MTKEISIYHEYEYFYPLKNVSKSQNPLNLDNNQNLKGYVLTILYSLYKYRCMNKTTLNNCINLKNKNKWKTKSLKKILQELRQEGYITAYGTSQEPTGDNFKTVLYILEQKGMDLLKERYKSIDESRLYSKEDRKAEILLKQASIVQYHISLITNYGYMINRSKFEGYRTKTQEIIPSYISFTRYSSSMELLSGKEKINLFALPGPRKEAELEEFLGEILRIINAEVEETEILKILIIVCENNTHAGWLSWKINKYRQARPFPILYIQDMVTASEDPLAQVMYCESDEEGILKSSINFFK